MPVLMVYLDNLMLSNSSIITVTNYSGWHGGNNAIVTANVIQVQILFSQYK